MRISELMEAITTDQINAALDSTDPARASLALLHSQVNTARDRDAEQKKADMRAEIARVAVIRDQARLRKELERILWKWKLSLDGMFTGTQTVRTKKGTGYREGFGDDQGG